jgi:hypothetical protein
VNGTGVDRGRFATGRAGIRQAILLAAFGASTFLAGRLWSLRAVREAQRAAGLAEQQRLRFQAELTECRNAMVLLRGYVGRSPEGVREEQGGRREPCPAIAGAREARNTIETRRSERAMDEP